MVVRFTTIYENWCCAFDSHSGRGVQHYVTCGRSVVFISGSSTNKTDRHDITEILLKVALNTINSCYLSWEGGEGGTLWPTSLKKLFSKLQFINSFLLYWFFLAYDTPSLSIIIWRIGGGGPSFLLPWGPKILLAALGVTSKDSYKYSFFPRTIAQWNLLPVAEVQCTTLESFREQIPIYVLEQHCNI